MTSRLELPLRAFFSVKEKPRAFQELLTNCFVVGGALTAKFDRATVILAVETADEITGGLCLRGQWRAPDFWAPVVKEVGVKLIMPLLFNTSYVCIPKREIYVLDRDDRSLAEFFVRNIFYAVSRRANVVFEEGKDCPSGSQSARDFRRQYLFVLNHYIAEDLFREQKSDDAIDLIFANSYLPISSFNSALLRKGGERLREFSNTDGAFADIAALKARLTTARNYMLAQLSV